MAECGFSRHDSHAVYLCKLFVSVAGTTARMVSVMLLLSLRV